MKLTSLEKPVPKYIITANPRMRFQLLKAESRQRLVRVLRTGLGDMVAVKVRAWDCNAYLNRPPTPKCLHAVVKQERIWVERGLQHNLAKRTV